MTSSMNREDIREMLTRTGEQAEELYRLAREKRDITTGNKVFLRGLIELSNTCSKNCLYCGIRASNIKAERYLLPEKDVVNAARFADENKYGSIVIQSGERNDREFIRYIGNLLKKIHMETGNRLKVTLSCGEQTEATYQYWKDSGADRYLLRIEASNPELYRKIHPSDGKHTWDARIKALHALIKCGYQTGTGVMIGLPFQTLDDLVSDLLFFKSSGVHMIGMGPYIEHPDTPLFEFTHMIPSPEERVRLSLNMIAALRLLEPEFNIASTTALQTLDPDARRKGILAGANVIMPNITPVQYKESYNLYTGKPGVKDSPNQVSESLGKMIQAAGCELALNEWGNPGKFKV